MSVDKTLKSAHSLEGRAWERGVKAVGLRPTPTTISLQLRRVQMLSPRALYGLPTNSNGDHRLVQPTMVLHLPPQ